MAFDVFISYPHQDKATADAACAKLEAEGIRCWIAPRDIAPSADWAASIIDAIDSCRIMILIFSGHTNRSRQVGREVQQAFDGEKPVVPFRIENVAPEKSPRYYMGSVHWLDAITQPVELHLQRLTTVVKGLLEATALGVDTQKGGVPREVEEVKTIRLAEDDKRQKVDRITTDADQTIQPNLAKGNVPHQSKEDNKEVGGGSVVVRSSGAILLLIVLVIVAAIAVVVVVRDALPSQETVTKCITAGGAGGGCGGNNLLFGVAIGIVFAAWRCAVWIWRRR